MDCPYCHSPHTTPLKRTTDLGYTVFRCQHCQRTFNERTGTPFNFIEVPTDILFQVLVCRFRYKLSYRDVAEFFLVRGFAFTHETVRAWEARFAPIFAAELRAKRKGNVGNVWHVDETYLRVQGRWCYLYRAIDQDGNLVDARLSETRDMVAANAFFQQAQDITDVPPERVFTDGHSSYPRAIKEELGAEVEHEVIPCLGNPIEQSHGASSNATIQPWALVPLSRPNASAKRMRRSINFSAPVSAWRNSCRYQIDENTFYSKLMRCKRYLKQLRGEKQGERCLSATNVRFEEPVLTLS